MSEIAPEWEELMDRAGYSSLRKLSEACGVSPATVAGIVLHGKPGSNDSVEKIAQALRVTVAQLNEIRTGRPEEPLRLPKGTEKLSPSEKEAVQTIIRSLVNAKESTYEHVTKKKTPPSKPVEEKKSSQSEMLATVHKMSPRADTLIEAPLGNAARTVKNAKQDEGDDPA